MPSQATFTAVYGEGDHFQLRRSQVLSSGHPKGRGWDLEVYGRDATAESYTTARPELIDLRLALNLLINRVAHTESSSGPHSRLAMEAWSAIVLLSPRGNVIRTFWS